MQVNPTVAFQSRSNSFESTASEFLAAVYPISAAAALGIRASPIRGMRSCLPGPDG